MPEQELSDAFVRAVGDSVPDLGLLVAGATAEGRGIRLRRRLALTGATTAVALLAVGGGLLLRPAAPPAAAPAAGPRTATGTAPPADALPADIRNTVLGTVKGFAPSNNLGAWRISDTESGSTPLDGPGISLLFHHLDASEQETGTLEVLVQRSPRPSVPPAPDDDYGYGYDCGRHPAADGCQSTSGPGFDAVTVTLPAEDGRSSAFRGDLLDHDGLRIVVTATGLPGGSPPLDRSLIGKLAVALRTGLLSSGDPAPGFVPQPGT
ncbi:hypothetical protein [Kitasatospora sp. NPDC057198]|uniref:hypothetical protein n=1 Tax=Kitasatospora sp. NPDC057198 TaxID=3346046 RepID=UPI0036351569